MEVRNCRRCRRLFNYLGGQNICPVCKDELEKQFLKVRDYIRENPGVPLQEVADANEVTPNQIKDWIKEGRLELAKGSAITLNCEKCGEPILRGRFCDKCNDKMADRLNALVQDNMKPKIPVVKDDHSPKMRFKKD